MTNTNEPTPPSRNQPRARRRRQPPLLSSDAQPITALASFDQLRLRFKRSAIYFRDRDAFNQYFRLVGAGALFSASDTRRHYELTIRTNWLFSGSLRFRFRTHAGRSYVSIDADLRLNPTRFLVHQNGDLVQLHNCAASQLLRKNPANAFAASTFTLDRNDNLLPPERWAATRPFLPYLEVYIRKVIELIDEQLLSAADEPREEDQLALLRGEVPNRDWDIVVNLNWSDGTIAYAEIYWEYMQPSALAYVHALAPDLAAIVGATETTPYPVPRAIPSRSPGQVRRRTQLNGLAVGVGLGAEDISLLVYAKEYDRVRFEVRYGSAGRQLLGRHGWRYREARDLNGLFGVLEALVADAKTRFERVWQHLPKGNSINLPSIDKWMELTSAIWAAAINNRAHFEHIVSVLLINGAISAARSEPAYPAVIALVRSGILVRVQSRMRDAVPRFRLTPRFRQTVDAVRRALSAN